MKLRRLAMKKGATVSRTGPLYALLVLTLSVFLVSSSAEARKWRWRHFYGVYDYGYVVPFGDDGWRDRVSERAETARDRTSGGFSAVIDRLIRGCIQQAAQLQSMPFDEITRIVAPDDTQRGALEALRASTTAGAQQFSAQCPQDDPAPPLARLEAVEQAIDTATATFAAVDPPLRAFYAALDDEQKARLLRDLTLSKPQARGDRAAERLERRSRRRGISGAARDGEANAWTHICEPLTEALRGWPIREIERRVGLSEPQRVAFYELVSSSLKVADTLAGACPAETALTPPARMALLRARLAAVRQATAAIRPALTQFYETLDQGPKVQFAGIR